MRRRQAKCLDLGRSTKFLLSDGSRQCGRVRLSLMEKGGIQKERRGRAEIEGSGRRINADQKDGEMQRLEQSRGMVGV